MRLRRRPTFTAALIFTVSGLLILTAGMVTGLAYLGGRASVEGLVRQTMAQATALTVDHAERFMHDAEFALGLGPELVRSGLLAADDELAVERYLVSVLRTRPQFTWASYASADQRFVGAWRDADGRVLLNRSWPVGDKVHMREWQLGDDGTRRLIRQSEDHGYLPTHRPFYRQAVAARRLVWTEPYGFFGQSMGITCAQPLLAEGGAEVRGVFTVDFSLLGLSDFLRGLHLTPNARIAIVDAAGKPIASGAAVPPLTPAQQATTELALEQSAPIHIGELGWQVRVEVPERDYLADVHAQTRRTVALCAAALALALMVAWGLGRWIARPLRELSAQARRVREGDLDVQFGPAGKARTTTSGGGGLSAEDDAADDAGSHDEIGELTQALSTMVAGLRDRDFIRDTLGRYVSPELAAQALRDRDSVRLGGALRRVTVLMSDLRGFSTLSARLGPEAMIGLVNRYLAVMTPVILDHQGTLNEILGDGLLVLFGAPFGRDDDAHRACLCALQMQAALAELRMELEREGLPALHMGIGLHTGEVVAGNIGTEARVKYGVVGTVVNTAARIEGLTGPGEILLSAETLAEAGAGFAVGPPRAVELKGLAAPIDVLSLLGSEGGRAAHGGVEGGGWQPFDAAVRVHAVEGVEVVGPALAARVIGRAALGLRLAMAQAPAVGTTFRLQVEEGPPAFGRVVAVDADVGPLPAGFSAEAPRWRCDVAVAAESWQILP